MGKDKIKVVVVGAGGVIGQHLAISVPPFVEAVFTRLHGGGIYRELDLCGDFGKRLAGWEPDVVVNLAGENSVDKVEADPEKYAPINLKAVAYLVNWCEDTQTRLIHISSQAALGQVNEYGKQKRSAEFIVRTFQGGLTLRPTFVLGVRPFPGVGRENPAEWILAGKEQYSVYDRFFSASFVWDVAEAIWTAVLEPGTVSPIQVGNPERMSRLSVALRLGADPKPVEHNSLGIAPRSLDTTYIDPWCKTSLEAGILRLKKEFMEREQDTLEYRSKEIAAFLGRSWEECLAKLQTGFGTLHVEVAEDFRRMSPKTDEELLEWYRSTEAYIWELTAYHCDAGFNYTGMCSGIVEALKSKGAGRVLCLGDGTGDLSLAINASGMAVTYHDLYKSRTAEFAKSRFVARLGAGHTISTNETADFSPLISETKYDAIASLDFLEHLPNVEHWVQRIYSNLKPGGWLMTQNAFNCGSGPEGSMPMHLVVNDHYEKDWDPLLSSIGFVQYSSNWYRRP